MERLGRGKGKEGDSHQFEQLTGRTHPPVYPTYRFRTLGGRAAIYTRITRFMGLRQNTEVRNHGRNDRTMKRGNKEENREGIDKRRREEGEKGFSLAERARVEGEGEGGCSGDDPLARERMQNQRSIVVRSEGHAARFLACRLCVQLSPYVARFERANWDAARPSDPGIRFVRIVVESSFPSVPRRGGVSLRE